LKPAPFKYAGCETVEEAVSLLGEYGDEAQVLAGGQSLVPLMNLRLAAPDVLVDVNHVRELQGLTANGTLEIGAMTRQADVERAAEVAADAPVVIEALRHVAFPAVRSRGTIGGSIAHADPAAELPAVLLALGGEVVVRGPAGTRTITADELFVTYFTTSLKPDELLTQVRIPRGDAGQRFAVQEVARKRNDFALAGAVVVAAVDEGGVCSSARIALFGVSDRPVRASGAEQALAGRRLDEAAADAEQAAKEEIDPKSDAHASAGYRRDVAGVLVRRAVAKAAVEGEGR
jgi:6-hydroxypseudooxynicotine dehydrogenase subunit alpha